MEKRAILAFGLSMLLLVLYMWVQERYFTPPPMPIETETVPETARRETTPWVPPVPAGAERAEAEDEEEAPRPRPIERRVDVDAPLYMAVISSDGGEVKEWVLHYRGEKALAVLDEQGGGALSVGLADAGAPAPVPMTVKPAELMLNKEEPAKRLLLAGEQAGVRVRQTLTFHPDSYAVDVGVRIENGGPRARAIRVELPWYSRQDWGGTPEQFPGQRASEVIWSSRGQVHRLTTGEPMPTQEIRGEWVAIGSIWYLAALVPRSDGWQIALQSDGKREEAGSGAPGAAGRVAVALTANPTIGSGEAWEGRAVLYVGPKEYERLKALGLQGTLDFGGFPIPRRWGGLPMEWLGVPILLLMKWVYGYVGNYGVAIILLTVLSKVLFYPLTVKSLRSMKAMQALQPQVNALRAKYKSDPQRAQREMMDLYRKHRVNPMGGCLPMVAQIPIFYALYLALSVSVELQNAAFLCVGRAFGTDLWICNLAAHDPTYILPILMGVTMFIQQKMMPVAGDPRQAKLMLVMPFVFTFMFLNLPSGLVLYWTVSNVLQVLQQWYMDRPPATAPREVKNASRA
jgi:YidC/Oxa1 family membrane protein insertase